MCAMWVAPMVNISVFLVAYCGVTIKGQGPSAQGFCDDGGFVVIVNGDRYRKMAATKSKNANVDVLLFVAMSTFRLGHMPIFHSGDASVAASGDVSASFHAVVISADQYPSAHWQRHCFMVTRQQLREGHSVLII